MTYTQCEKCHTPLTTSDLVIRFEVEGHPRDATCHKCGHVHRLTRMEACEATIGIIDMERRLSKRGIMPWDSKRTEDIIKIRKEAERDAREHARAEVEEMRARLDADPEWQERKARLREYAEKKLKEKAELPLEAPLLESVPETEPAPILTETITKPLTIKKSTLDIWM